MKFKYLQKRVVLHGIKEGVMTEVKANRVKLTEEGAQISCIYINKVDEGEFSELLSVGVRADTSAEKSVGVRADTFGLESVGVNAYMPELFSVGVSADAPNLFSVGVSAEDRTGSRETDSGLKELLREYGDIFEEPQTLPPHRVHHDHQIPLMEGSNPINQRPYRYALY